MAKKFLGCELEIDMSDRKKNKKVYSHSFFIPGGLPREDRDAFLAAVRSHVYVSDEVVNIFKLDWNSQKLGSYYPLD